jgi:predicted ATPase/DNA-binding winged helix-turn-helix (wHTH) protein
MKRAYNDGVSFGPFQLFPTARVLEKDGEPVTLGSRALDLLIVLVEHAGKIVSSKELISRVWRDLVVEPGNLRVHMRALRKVLADDADGDSYIENVIGQGYSFVAPVQRIEAPDTMTAAASAQPALQLRALPPAPARMIGRDATVRTIAADLRTDRFVTIVGPGGMGKTTVAISVAHAMLAEFDGSVCFVDLGAIADPRLLPATIASTLGLTIQSVDALVSLMAFLQRARMLLVLDNCEHVIDAAASLAETIFQQAPDVYILATSREALRAEGEHVHRLRPLGVPPPEATLSAATALAFPAVNLFVDRAIASNHRFELTDANARIVADICGRLDGIALALELVAGRVGTYGLEGTADLLSKRLGLHWQGRRTALPRHQTLQALLDWSYSLLPAVEQGVLRKLSIFVGAFTLDAALSIVSDVPLDEAQLTCAIEQLIGKSLISAISTREDTTRYRLLETTRLYATRKLEESGEADATAERHAQYFIHLLRSTAAERGGITSRHEHLGNLRAALEWCLGDSRRAQTSRAIELGIDLAAASASVFLELSLWNECRKWSEAALAHLEDSKRGDRCELVLQDALAVSSLLINAVEARTAITRGLEIAERLGETAIRFRLLGALHVYELRMTEFQSGLAVAEEMDAVAKTTSDVTYRVISEWMLGSSHYVLGNPATSRKLFESGFERGGPRDAGKGQQLAGLYYRTRALYGLARVQWLCGYPDHALRSARQAVAEAAETGSPVNLSYALVYCCYIFLWCGDLDTAQEMIGKVMAQPHWEGRLVWFHAEALALEGELLVRRGKIEEGIALLRRVLEDMQASRQKNLMQTVTACGLAEGLALAGRTDEALTVIDAAIALSPGGTETWDGPELLRVKASVLLSMSHPDLERAETAAIESLASAQRQGAKGWELRTTMTLAQLRVMQGRPAEARTVLAAIYDQFKEGFETRDLREAATLLRDLDRTTMANAISR